MQVLGMTLGVFLWHPGLWARAIDKAAGGCAGGLIPETCLESRGEGQRLRSIAVCCPTDVPEPDGVQQLSEGKEKLALPSQWAVKIIEKKTEYISFMRK